MRIKIRKEERGETTDIWDFNRDDWVLGPGEGGRQPGNITAVKHQPLQSSQHREIWAFPVRVFPPYDLKLPISPVNQRSY